MKFANKIIIENLECTIEEALSIIIDVTKYKDFISYCKSVDIISYDTRTAFTTKMIVSLLGDHVIESSTLCIPTLNGYSVIINSNGKDKIMIHSQWNIIQIDNICTVSNDFSIASDSTFLFGATALSMYTQKVLKKDFINRINFCRKDISD